MEGKELKKIKDDSACLLIHNGPANYDRQGLALIKIKRSPSFNILQELQQSNVSDSFPSKRWMEKIFIFLAVDDDDDGRKPIALCSFSSTKKRQSHTQSFIIR